MGKIHDSLRRKTSDDMSTPITKENAVHLEVGDCVYNTRLGETGTYVGPHGNIGIEWKRGAAGASHYSPFHLMMFLSRPHLGEEVPEKVSEKKPKPVLRTFMLGLKTGGIMEQPEWRIDRVETIEAEDLHSAKLKYAEKTGLSKDKTYWNAKNLTYYGWAIVEVGKSSQRKGRAPIYNPTFEQRRAEIERIAPRFLALHSNSSDLNPTFLLQELGFAQNTEINKLLRPLIAKYAARVLVDSGIDTRKMFTR